MQVIEGLDDVTRALRQLPRKAQRAVIREAVKPGAELVADTARNKCPVDSGALKASIKVRAFSRKGLMGFRIGTPKGFFKGDEFYAGFIEYGTAHMAARPFLRPALQLWRGLIRQRAMASMRRLLKIGTSG